MTGGKLAAAVLMSCVAVGAIMTFGYDIQSESPDLVTPVIAAALIGMYSGWQQLGRNLGGEYVQSGLFGVGASGVTVMFFAFFYGVRSAYLTHKGVQFDSGVSAVLHVVKAGWGIVLETIFSYPTLLELIIGGFIAGMIAELCDRAWN